MVVCFTLGAVAAGEDIELGFSPARTTVEFTLADVLHTVHGSFKLKRGQIRFDPGTGKAAGELVVDATSGSSGSNGRDRRMHKNILESDRYPEITFRPDRVEGKVAARGASLVRVHGMFAIHGAEHEITVPVQVESGASQLTATLRFPVPYVKWGMKNPSNLILRVSDTVTIDIHTVMEVGGSAAITGNRRPAPQL